MTEDVLRHLYRERFGADAEVTPLAVTGSASNRRFFRLQGDGAPSAIGILGEDPNENRAFFAFTQTFRELGLPVPEIYAVDEHADAWIEQDLGDTTMFHVLTTARPDPRDDVPPGVEALYRRVLDVLPRFQVEGGRAIDYGAAYPRAAYDRQSVTWDLDYFKYCFLKLAHVPFHEARLERDFERFTEHLLAVDLEYFLYRDFQTRNIMVLDGEPWFIDYQGGRRGPLHYDLASLLYSGKTELKPAFRDRLTEHYLDALEAHVTLDRAAFRDHLRSFALVRIMQAMGTYGYRGFYERKRHFVLSVAPAIDNIEGLLTQGLSVDVPELRRVLESICENERLRTRLDDNDGRLTLHTGSFSYKRGYPPDVGGHGGGFVFDCRALPNPGREEQYKGLSGHDAAVIDYLRGSEAVSAYLARAVELVDAQLDTYAARGFDSLSVYFGCTGGQHRSVYLAERLVEHVRGRMPDLRIACTHAESDRWPASASRTRGT